MGHGQEVFYARGATRDDAEHFGEALKKEGYFDDTTAATVWIAGKAGAREISFIGGEGAWDDESYMEAVRAMAERIAPGHRRKTPDGAHARRVLEREETTAD